MPDRLAWTTFSADFSFIGTANTYDICIHVVVKAYWCPLDVTSRWPIVSIANTAIETCGISVRFGSYVVGV